MPPSGRPVTAPPFGRLAVALGDGATREWLQGCLGGDFATLEFPADDAPGAVGEAEVVLVDERKLEQPAFPRTLGACVRGGTPILVVGPVAGWAGARQNLVALGFEVFDYLSPSDTCEAVRLRLDRALRSSPAPLGSGSLPGESLERERNRVVAQLAGAVAHKLKQPLTVALGFMELVLEDPDPALETTTVHYLRQVREAMDTMNDVVNRLQEATRYQTRPYAGTLEILDIEDGASAGARVASHARDTGQGARGA